MNLRDKLRAVAGEKKPAAPPPETAHNDCWRRDTLRGAESLPALNAPLGDIVPLMQPGEVPAGLRPERILYLDTETTGLGGGAGTVAFEIGLGWETSEGFAIRQLVMRDYPEERWLLRETEALLSRFDAVCTFNGSTFDLPLLRSRFLMNRMDPACLDLPHIDLVHIARRVFRLRLGHCNLGRLEEVILGQPRQGDLPGSEVPQRFFTYLKTGEFGLLEEVLAHNEQDVASMCVLLRHMVRCYANPELLGHAEDLLSMGAALEHGRHAAEARRCYQLIPAGRLHAMGQLRLAANLRRSGARGDAKEVWLGMIRRREGGAQPYIELAKHYEHVERDIPAALEMTVKAIALLSEPSLQGEAVQTLRNALQYRYDRLARKAGASRKDT